VMRVGAIPKGRGVYFEDAAIKLLGGACFGLGARLVTECQHSNLNVQICFMSLIVPYQHDPLIKLDWCLGDRHGNRSIPKIRKSYHYQNPNTSHSIL
jgi:hypothetical protein